MSIDHIKTVGVLGAGTMGNGIAHVFARSGFQVKPAGTRPGSLGSLVGQKLGTPILSITFLKPSDPTADWNATKDAILAVIAAA